MIVPSCGTPDGLTALVYKKTQAIRAMDDESHVCMRGVCACVWICFVITSFLQWVSVKICLPEKMKRRSVKCLRTVAVAASQPNRSNAGTKITLA